MTRPNSPTAAETPAPVNLPHPPRNEQHAYAVLARMMPWAISALLHVGAFLIMLCAIFFTVSQPTAAHELHIPGIAETPTPMNLLDATPTPSPATSSQSARAAQSPRPRPTATPNTGKTQSTLDILGTIGGSGAASAANFGPLRSGKGPGGIFSPPRGPGGNSDDIVYVVDRSGSMLDTFQSVTYNMALSVSGLASRGAGVHRNRGRRFGILFFAEGKPLAFESGRLVAPTAANRVAAAEFLETVVPLGQTDPIPALKTAFAALHAAQSKTRPRNQLIYLLTDGVFPDNDAAIQLVAAECKRNPHVKLCTLLYGHRPPEAEATLKRIANLSGGLYRYIPLED